MLQSATSKTDFVSVTACCGLAMRFPSCVLLYCHPIRHLTLSKQYSIRVDVGVRLVTYLRTSPLPSSEGGGNFFSASLPRTSAASLSGSRIPPVPRPQQGSRIAHRRGGLSRMCRASPFPL